MRNEMLVDDVRWIRLCVLKQAVCIVHVEKRLVIAQRDIRRGQIAQKRIVDVQALTGTAEPVQSGKEAGQIRRIRRARVLPEKDLVKEQKQHRKQDAREQHDDQDQKPQRKIVPDEITRRHTHEVRRDDRRNDAGRNGEDVAGKLHLAVAAVIADRTEGDQRHDEQQVQQKLCAAVLFDARRKLFDLLFVLFVCLVAEPERIDEHVDDRCAETDAEIAQQQRDPERITQARRDLNELRRDEDDDHLQRFDQYDGQKAEHAPRGKQIFCAFDVVCNFQTDERDQNVG